MNANSRIYLTSPQTKKKSKYFSLQLKQNMFNQPSIYEGAGKILAISDIEGNFMRMVQHLLVNNVVDKTFRWTFGEGHLVVVGDCFDRGEEVVECLWLIYALEERARRHGGYVHYLLGNHEIMNMNGDWRYVHPKYASVANTAYNVIYYGNNEIWKWLKTKNMIEKIGDTLFVHGGISKELLQLNIPIEEINERARPYYVAATPPYSNALNRILFNDDTSPLWYRGYYNQEQLSDQEELINNTLDRFGVNTIVTGHTVMEKITSFYDGKLINIDTNHASSFSESLLIKKGKFYRIKNNGRTAQIKVK